MASSKTNLAIHGVLVNIDDTGVLLIGVPGIGKSECALDLVAHGQTLIADDVIEVSRVDDTLLGSVPERFAGLLHVRDLGVIDVRELFRIGAFESISRIDLCIELIPGNDDQLHDRIGDGIIYHELLQVKIRKFEIAVGVNRNIPLLVTTAAKLFRLRAISAADSLILSHNLLVSSATTEI